jgi:GNAT superfamily N-acetyltransferase
MSTPNPIYRPAIMEDFDQCLALDHSYETSRVWQMTLSQQPELVGVRFQAVRLPKPTTIPYPYSRTELLSHWWEVHWFLVGEAEDGIQAYVTATLEKLRPVAWIGDLVVTTAVRRRGYGTQLLAQAASWAKQEHADFLMAALPMKNDPAMQFLKKNGFTFCGYNEAQFDRRDIALYFSLKV